MKLQAQEVRPQGRPPGSPVLQEIICPFAPSFSKRRPPGRRFFAFSSVVHNRNIFRRGLVNRPFFCYNTIECMALCPAAGPRTCSASNRTPSGRSFSAMLCQIFLQYIQYCCKNLSAPGKNILCHPPHVQIRNRF